MEQVKKTHIPKGERVWVSYLNHRSELVFVLTSNSARDFYFLYEVLEDGKLNKLGKAKSPFDLERKFKVQEIIKKGGSKS